MKNYFLFVLFCLVLLLNMSCKSTVAVTATTPHFYTHTSQRFEVLGEVLFESSTRVGFVEFLKTARNLYPNCDYVIDIMVDQRVTTTTETTSFFMRKNQSVNTETTWIMRGTAIRYTR